MRSFISILVLSLLLHLPAASASGGGVVPAPELVLFVDALALDPQAAEITLRIYERASIGSDLANMVPQLRSFTYLEVRDPSGSALPIDRTVIDREQTRTVRIYTAAGLVGEPTVEFVADFEDGRSARSSNARHVDVQVRVPPPSPRPAVSQQEQVLGEWSSNEFAPWADEGGCGTADSSALGDFLDHAMAGSTCASGYGRSEIRTPTSARAQTSDSNHYARVHLSSYSLHTETQWAGTATAKLDLVLYEWSSTGSLVGSSTFAIATPCEGDNCERRGDDDAFDFQFTAVAGRAYSPVVAASAIAASLQGEGLVPALSSGESESRSMHVTSLKILRTLPDRLTAVTITAAPTSIAAGAAYQVCWSVSGAGPVSHTGIHWGTASGSYPNHGATKSGSGGETFCDNSLVAPSSPGTIYMKAHAVGPSDPNLLSSQKTITVTSSGGGGNELWNGGEGGRGYDLEDFRGKYFTSANTGTITQVCVYSDSLNSVATVAVKPSPNNAAPTFTKDIGTGAGGTGWKCENVSWTWSASTLFIYKTGGNAAIGYDDGAPADSYYSFDSGASWNGPENWRRGFKLVYGSGSSTELKNGGEGPNYDDHAYRGKYFSSGAPTGTITQVCVYAQGSGQTVDLALKPAPASALTSFTVSFTTTGAGWQCKTGLSQTWSATSLFVYKTGGTVAIGYDAGSPSDSYYSFDNGASWNGPESWRRGFKVVFGSGGSTPPSLENGGTGPNYDDHSYRGKYFPSASTGTISQVCVYAQASGQSVDLALKPTPSSASDTFTVSFTTTGSGWQCKTGLSQAWSASSLFVYKTGGTVAIGYDGAGPTYDSYYSFDNGASWNGPESWRRGFKIVYA